jgi:hypothetical protein
MKSSDKRKKAEGVKGLELFLNQFGTPDIHTKLVLEILFEEMYNESLSLSGEARQRGGASNSTPEKQDSTTKPSE